MTTKPTQPYAASDENIIQQLLNKPIDDKAEHVELADASAALVSVLIETDHRDTRILLCEKLLQTLGQMRESCHAELSPQLIAQLIEGEKISNAVPACWQDMATQVDYALGLTQAVLGGTLPSSVEKTLTALLHDMVWLLAEFVKEPSGAAY